MTVIDEIAPDIFRISTFVAQWNLQFNQFLIRDQEPLLFHAGMRTMFPEIHKAVAKVIKPSDLRWISFSHFEADECGALNDWFEVAPRSKPACSIVAA